MDCAFAPLISEFVVVLCRCIGSPQTPRLSRSHKGSHRTAVQAEASPIPQLESENVGRGADLEDHAVPSRTVNGARRNQEMVVLTGRKAIDVLLCIKR